MEADFNAAYYSAIAQVIPTLFIAAIATRYFRREGDIEEPRRTPILSSLMLLMIGFVAIGEVNALDALNHREVPTDFKEGAITLGYMFPLGFIVVDLAVVPALELLDHLGPKWSTRALYGVGVLLIALAIFGLVGGDAGSAMSLILLVLFLFVMGFNAVSKDLAARRRDRDKT